MNDKTVITPGYADSLWDFFASTRLTVVVLLTLAALSIIGTVVPQNQSPADYFRTFGPFVYQLFTILGVFDMYHAWWFQFLILLLVVNIVICSIDRLQATWKIIFVKTPQFNLERFRQRQNRREFEVVADSEQLKARFSQSIAKTFGYCRVVATEQGFAVTAEKGRWTRLGVYGVHLSVVILLIGGVVGARFGFDGFVNIPEAESTDIIELRNSGQPYRLPFAIRCDNFDVQFYETGAPKEFRSQLTILENGKAVLQKDIIVNDPLRFKGINIFQSSYGKLSAAELGAEAAAPAEAPEEIELNFRSAASGMIYSAKTTLGQAVTIPEDLGRFVVERYESAAEFKGMAVGPALVGTLIPPAGEAQQVLLPFKYPKFDAMRQGSVMISVTQQVTAQEPRYFTGLQVTRDPGVGLVYTGFILMIVGCAVTFFMSHQQVVVEVRPKGRRLAVMVAGTANKHKMGFQNKLQRLADKLKTVAGQAS